VQGNDGEQHVEIDLVKLRDLVARPAGDQIVSRPGIEISVGCKAPCCGLRQHEQEHHKHDEPSERVVPRISRTAASRETRGIGEHFRGPIGETGKARITPSDETL